MHYPSHHAPVVELYIDPILILCHFCVTQNSELGTGVAAAAPTGYDIIGWEEGTCTLSTFFCLCDFFTIN